MLPNEYDPDEIKRTDIVFECHQCGKSLAIDYRGAGLTIPCSDCGSQVQVPIPPWMEISDLDSSEEEQETRIRKLRRLLTTSECRIEELEGHMAELVERRDVLERSRSAHLTAMGHIRESVQSLRAAVNEAERSIESILRALEQADAEPPAPQGS